MAILSYVLPLYSVTNMRSAPASSPLIMEITDDSRNIKAIMVLHINQQLSSSGTEIVRQK